MSAKKRPNGEGETPPAEGEVAGPEAQPLPVEVEVPAGGNADIVRLEGEVAGLKDQLLRLAADFDNYRKRTRKEMDEVRRYGIEGVLGDLLQVVDNLDRALSHSEGDKSPVIQGVRMVQKQFSDVLSRFGVVSFSAMGQPFDPERHEAVGQAPAGDKAPGTILEEAQKGYMLHDRLLRPARVIVAAAAEGRNGTEEGASAPGE